MEKGRKKSLPKDPKRVQSLGRFHRADTGQIGMEKQVYALENEFYLLLSGQKPSHGSKQKGDNGKTQQIRKISS